MDIVVSKVVAVFNKEEYCEIMVIFWWQRMIETYLQVELNKRREQELIKLRRDLEENTMNHESQVTILRKKNQDALNELNDQLDQLTKHKNK